MSTVWTLALVYKKTDIRGGFLKNSHPCNKNNSAYTLSDVCIFQLFMGKLKSQFNSLMDLSNEILDIDRCH